MNVYGVRHDRQHFEWLGAEATDRQRWLEYTNFTPLGQSVGAGWTALRFSSTVPKDEDCQGVLPTGDFVGVNPRFALGPRAMETAGDLMAQQGELLPVDHSGLKKPLYWFHCTTLIDAMEEPGSVLERFPGGNKVSAVKRLWLQPQKLRDALIFHIPQSRSLVLCTDTFKRHIEALGLTGLKFTLKWSDEPAGKKQISDWEKRGFFNMPPFPVPIPD